MVEASTSSDMSRVVAVSTRFGSKRDFDGKDPLHNCSGSSAAAAVAADVAVAGILYW